MPDVIRHPDLKDPETALASGFRRNDKGLTAQTQFLMGGN